VKRAGPARRERVVGPGAGVAEGDGRPGPQVQRAVVVQPPQVPAGIGGEDLDVLEGVAIGDRAGLLRGGDEMDRAVAPPGGPGHARERQLAELAVDLEANVGGEGRRRRDEHRARVGVHLGLGEQVGRDDLGVGALVGHDQDLGGTAEDLDPDAAQELALRLDDVRAARGDDDVHAGDGLGAEGQGRETVDAADGVDLVRAGERHGGDVRRHRTPIAGRGARDDAWHARDLRGHDAHLRGGDGQAPASRHIRAHGGEGDVTMPKADAREGLDLHVAQRGPLCLGEALDLRLGEADVLARGGRDLVDAALDVALGQPELVGGPAVSAHGVVVDRVVAAAPHRIDDMADGLGDLAPAIVIGIDRA